MSIFSKLASLVGDAFPPAKLVSGVIDLVKGETGQDISNLAPEIQALTVQRDSDRDKYAAEIKKVEIEASRDVVVSETKGNALQRNWRPLTMVTFLFIIVNNYIFVPYAVAFGLPVVALELTPWMGALMTTGMGGYIVSRHREKIAGVA